MNKQRVIALYLPQFHSIPENDEWWGKGFTEWKNVEKAKSLFKGHNQPRVPLNENYYNLLDDNTFKWQINLAKKYGIDGFCFYHYWFNGKLLLEKPLENYLANKELDLPYFFSWANEPWTRSWDGGNRTVLVGQAYGGMDDIINHFNYMLPFFHDSRYMKIDNKPIFVLYRAETISYLQEMIQKWNDLAQKNGFEGILFVESLNVFQGEKYCDDTNACFYMEPMWVHRIKDSIIKRVFRHISWLLSNTSITKIDYETSMKKIVSCEKISEKRYAGFFVDWDNSPRRGGKGSVIYTNTSTILFEKYLAKQMTKMKKFNCPFLFINAWNEWAEGTYLEPDNTNGYAFLEAIKHCKETIFS